MGVSKRNKRYCIVFFCTVCSLIGSLLFYAFIFDPWQLFHQPWFRDPIFVNNARFQNAGIINSYAFDSVIIGNSMAENFSANEASQQLGGKFVNLSVAGSLFSERDIILKHLFNKKDVKKVIITLDHLPYVGVGQFNKDVSPEKYSFLYNKNPFDDFRIYFDVELLKCWDLNKSCWDEIPGVRRKTLEELYPWYPYYVKAFGGIDAWCNWSKKSEPFKGFLKQIIHDSKQIDKGKKSPWSQKLLDNCKINARTTFNTYILPHIQNNKETQFYLFFPPYSRLWYASMEQYYTGYFQSYLSFVEYVVKKTSAYSNVFVFGFDNMDFTVDLANYKDQSHYHPKINSKILQLMSQRNHVISEDSLEEYLITISELAANYDLKKISTEFEACLNQ